MYMNKYTCTYTLTSICLTPLNSWFSPVNYDILYEGYHMKERA